jgi:hypothetical protein
MWVERLHGAVAIKIIGGFRPGANFRSAGTAARFRLDCVIRGVKVEGLLRQATVIELRPNRRQHHPQQQPFDPVRRSGQSQRLQVSHAATQATSSNHMWPQEGDLAIAHRHADRGRLRLCIDRMVALIVRHMIFSSRQTYGCMHPCL